VTRSVIRRRALLRWVTFAVCLTAGAALNIYRVSSWKTSGFHSPRGFQDPPEYADGQRAYWARSFAKVEVFNQFWRPMRVTVTMRAAAAPEGVRVAVWADRKVMGTFALQPSWSRHSFVIADDAPLDGRLWLRLEGETVPVGPRGFAFATVETAPVFAARPIIVHGLFGAVLGVLAWWLLSPRRMMRAAHGVPRSRAPSSSPDSSLAGSSLAPPPPEPLPLAPHPYALMALSGVLFVYLSCWALLRPPFQTPDEPQHHLRTASILLHPWFADPSRFALDARYVSPLTFREPRPIAKLPFYPNERLTAAEIAQVKATPWNREWVLEPFERIYASYPTLFYLSLFAIAQPITEWLDLTPYQSSFAYRFVTAGLAALLWTAVYAMLRQTTETRSVAGWIVALIVLNPMVAFMSSGLNPDAMSIPLSTLAILAVWRVLSHGIHRGRALAWLLAAALIKPSAGALFIGLASGIAVLWLARRRQPASSAASVSAPAPKPVVAEHAGPALLVVFQAAIIAAWSFYLWSPLLFADQQGSHASLREYVITRIRRIDIIAIELWGRLGWLDYQIANGWYVLLYVLVMINVACVWWRPRRPLAFAAFAGAVFVAFAMMTLAGEFAYLTQAGYTLQGRYFLPAVLGLIAPVLWHRVPPARYALLAGLIVVNLLLAQRTVTRYYEDDWTGVRQALPFP
jgi:hypothetical protein